MGAGMGMGGMTGTAGGDAGAGPSRRDVRLHPAGGGRPAATILAHGTALALAPVPASVVALRLWEWAARPAGEAGRAAGGFDLVVGAGEAREDRAEGATILSGTMEDAARLVGAMLSRGDGEGPRAVGGLRGWHPFDDLAVGGYGTGDGPHRGCMAEAWGGRGGVALRCSMGAGGGRPGPRGWTPLWELRMPMDEAEAGRIGAEWLAWVRRIRGG